jgi:hypothetical protein
VTSLLNTFLNRKSLKKNNNLTINYHYQAHSKRNKDLEELVAEPLLLSKRNIILYHHPLSVEPLKKDKSLPQNLEGIMIGVIFQSELIINFQLPNLYGRSQLRA